MAIVEPKVYLYGSIRMGEYSKVSSMSYVIEHIIKLTGDTSVEVHVSPSRDPDDWDSFTMIYDKINSKLQTFLNNIGPRNRCIITGDCSWELEVDNQFEPLRLPNIKAPLRVFNM